MDNKESLQVEPGYDWQRAQKLVRYPSSIRADSPHTQRSVVAPIWYGPTGGNSKTWIEEVYKLDENGKPVLGEDNNPLVTEYKLSALSFFSSEENWEKETQTVAVIKPDGTFTPNGKRFSEKDHSTVERLIDEISEVQAIEDDLMES